MNRVLQWVSLFLVVVAVHAVFQIGQAVEEFRTSIFPQVQTLVTSANVTVAETNRTLKLVADYTEKQKKILESPKNQAALEAGWQTAAVLNGTLRVINKSTLPKVHVAIEEVTSVATNLSASAKELENLVRGTNISVNSVLLPQVLMMTESSTQALRTLNGSIEGASTRANLSLDQINALLADPVWLETMKEVRNVAANIDGTTLNIKVATDELPAIAKSLEEIAKTSSRWQKPILGMKILSIVMDAFFY